MTSNIFKISIVLSTLLAATGCGDSKDKAVVASSKGSCANLNFDGIYKNHDNDDKFRIYQDGCTGVRISDFQTGKQFFIRLDGSAYSDLFPSDMIVTETCPYKPRSDDMGYPTSPTGYPREDMNYGICISAYSYSAQMIGNSLAGRINIKGTFYEAPMDGSTTIKMTSVPTSDGSSSIVFSIADLSLSTTNPSQGSTIYEKLRSYVYEQLLDGVAHNVRLDKIQSL